MAGHVSEALQDSAPLPAFLLSLQTKRLLSSPSSSHLSSPPFVQHLCVTYDKLFTPAEINDLFPQ